MPQTASNLAEEGACKQGPPGRPPHTEPYAVETCRASGGCPNAVGDVTDMADLLWMRLESLDAAGVALSKADGPLRPHGRLTVSVSGCANACSRPQIADFGLIAREEPVAVAENCTECGLCEQACREEAVRVGEEGPVIDRSLCLGCGVCARVCPTGGLVSGASGWRAMAGGRLGRHPKLAQDIAGRASRGEVGAFLARLIEVWDKEGRSEERIGAVLDRVARERGVGTDELLAGSGKEPR